MYESIYNQTVTILNKLKRADTGGSSDIWQKFVVNDAAWYSQVERTVTGGNVAIGSYIVCMIPFHDEYKDYFDWKTSHNGFYTMSVGDYVVLGTVTETITASNIVATMTNYEPNVCLVKHFEELHDRYGAFIQLRIEGT